MIETPLSHPVIILSIGVVVVLAILIKSGLKRLGLPPLVGFIGLGFLLNLAHTEFGFFGARSREIFQLLAEIGVITLLFRIGLESNLAGLLTQLKRASYVWLAGVAISAAVGYLAAAFAGLALVPSLFVAIALTATSVGVSVGVWHEAGALESTTGELLVDVAEMDDISGIIFMALLFAIAPVLQSGQSSQLLPLVCKTGGLLLLKLAGFGLVCYFFSHYLEERVTTFFRRTAVAPALMLVVAGLGFILAASAGVLGFSVAIGAFFAGLVFSRDPEAVRIDASFDSLYELFSPFFFVGLGLHLDPRGLTGALDLGVMLLIAAILGKLLGHGLPAMLPLGWRGGMLIGASMIPRAEIAMIIMQQGLNLGRWAVPQKAYAAMVLVSAVTCIGSPLAVRRLLGRWPETREAGTR